MTSETYSLSYFNIAMQFYKEQLVKLRPQFCFFLVYSTSRYAITFDIMHYCIPNKIHIKSLNLTGSLLVRMPPYGLAAHQFVINSENHQFLHFYLCRYTIKLLLTSSLLHTENIYVMSCCTDLTSFGPYGMTSQQIFTHMG